MRKNILIIRRDNIGDLICTTPLISSLRKSFPHACIDVFVNSYNAPVVSENSEIDNIYIYKKAKHKADHESIFKIYLDRLLTYLKLRSKGVDIAILAGGAENKRSLKVAKTVGAKQIIGYIDHAGDKAITTPIDISKTEGMHEAELTQFLASPLGVDETVPACTLNPTSSQIEDIKKHLNALQVAENEQPIGLHISARKPSNRWTKDKHIQLIHQLWAKYERPVMLFWSPGSQDNPLHPGDDELAASIVQQCPNIKLIPYPTQSLEQLIAATSLCKPFICSDGGAMHIAAAVGCPILCFFGDSDAKRWHPWGVQYALLQKQSLNVSDISVDEALDSLAELI
ncbi:hypothetical protein ACH42_10350 [Endozoicomonas sp. (ex Bugula neritina AB1)]|nr:hypothetical protein ACH42_10350 [Endozoicomonas sp. (ex Bugula neritina AB1)]